MKKIGDSSMQQSVSFISSMLLLSSCIMRCIIVLLDLVYLSYSLSIIYYDEELARMTFDHAAAVYSENPKKCLRKYNQTKLLRFGKVPCDYMYNKVIFFIKINKNEY